MLAYLLYIFLFSVSARFLHAFFIFLYDNYLKFFHIQKFKIFFAFFGFFT